MPLIAKKEKQQQADVANGVGGFAKKQNLSPQQKRMCTASLDTPFPINLSRAGTSRAIYIISHAHSSERSGTSF